MKGDAIAVVAHATITVACLVLGVLCLLTYRRDRSERLYLFFAVAFWSVGLSWAALAMVYWGWL